MKRKQSRNGQSKSASELRKQVLGKVRRFYQASERTKSFVPGESAIPYAGRVYNAEELVNLVDASLDFWLTAGRYAARFEAALAKFVGMKHCLMTNSGSSANLLAVSALKSPLLGARRLKDGDEVITVACGFPTTVNPILQNNLTPVFVDVDLGTYNIESRGLERAVSKRTKAIFIAHTLGNPCDLGAVLNVARRHNLWVLEDNCDALGSIYRGKRTGSFGHISTCSFYPPHHITTGEGGAVLTSDPLLKKILLSLRDWGRDCWCESGKDNTCRRRFSWQLGALPFGYDHKYVYSHIGYNVKATDLQAAVGVAQLAKLPSFVRARRRNFQALYRFFSRWEKYFVLPETTANSEPSWFGFPLLVREGAPFSRAEIVNFLERRKVATRMLFAGNLLRHPAYQGIRCRVVGKLVNSDAVMNRLFWIGVYPGLTSERKNYVFEMAKEFLSVCQKRKAVKLAAG